MNLYSFEGDAETPFSVAITKGLMYIEFPLPFFIHSLSNLRRVSSPSKNNSSGKSGICKRLEEIFILFWFSSGLNIQILSSSALYAFIPSNTACP